MKKTNDDNIHSENDDLESEAGSFLFPLNWFRDPSTVSGDECIDRYVHNFNVQSFFGTRGTFNQCRFVHDARQTLSDDEMKQFCEKSGCRIIRRHLNFCWGPVKRFRELPGSKLLVNGLAGAVLHYFQARMVTLHAL